VVADHVLLDLVLTGEALAAGGDGANEGPLAGVSAPVPLKVR